jgi:hypothetical protein
MATRLDIQTRIQSYFNNSIYYTVTDMNNSIQDGLDEIAAFSGCVWASASIPFTQYTTYYDMLTLLPNYIGIYAMYNATINRWMWPQSLKKFNQARIDWDNAYGTPYYFSPVNHRYVAIYYKPSVGNYGNMNVFYRASAPSPLADGTIIPIPDENMLALESYSKMDLWEQAQEFTKAESEMKVYVEYLEKLRVLMRSQRNRDRMMSLR